MDHETTIATVFVSLIFIGLTWSYLYSKKAGQERFRLLTLVLGYGLILLYLCVDGHLSRQANHTTKEAEVLQSQVKDLKEQLSRAECDLRKFRVAHEGDIQKLVFVKAELNSIKTEIERAIADVRAKRLTKRDAIARALEEIAFNISQANTTIDRDLSLFGIGGAKIEATVIDSETGSALKSLSYVQ